MDKLLTNIYLKGLKYQGLTKNVSNIFPKIKLQQFKRKYILNCITWTPLALISTNGHLFDDQCMPGPWYQLQSLGSAWVLHFWNDLYFAGFDPSNLSLWRINQGAFGDFFSLHENFWTRGMWKKSRNNWYVWTTWPCLITMFLPYVDGRHGHGQLWTH